MRVSKQALTVAGVTSLTIFLESECILLWVAHDDKDTLEKIKQAFAAHRQALDALEKAILEGFENQSLRNGNELLSIRQVSQQLAVGRSWVYQQINSGQLPSVQLGGNLRVKREDLEEYIQNHRRSQQNTQ